MLVECVPGSKVVSGKAFREGSFKLGRFQGSVLEEGRPVQVDGKASARA